MSNMFKENSSVRGIHKCSGRAIRYGVKGDLIIMPGDPTAKNEGVTAQVYRDMLEEELPTLMNADTIFMHDNAPIHTARKVKGYLQEMAFQVLNWPPYSPDLNPIENMWKLLKQGIHEKYPKLATLSSSNESLCQDLHPLGHAC